MKSFLFIQLSLLSSLITIAQDSQSDFCKSFTKIFSFIKNKSELDTVVEFPMGLQRKVSIYSTQRYGHDDQFYSCLAHFPGELSSEFHRHEGKFDFQVVLASYRTKREIDVKGKQLRKLLLNCITRANWRVSDSTPDFYLSFSYLPRDISVHLFQYKAEENKYELIIGIITFGSYNIGNKTDN